jgi:elongation factor 1-alpha
MLTHDFWACCVSIYGVSSGFADYALVLVKHRHPPTHMTKHHLNLNLCCSLRNPIVVVFTKIDGCPAHALKLSTTEVKQMLRTTDARKKPFMIQNIDHVATVMEKMESLVPIIEISCVTGEGIDLLQKLLFAVPKRRRHEQKSNRPFELLVEDIFNVPHVGPVVSGFVNAGKLTVGANRNVFVGPMDDGTFLKTVAKSAHIAQIYTLHITSG